jgi:hypothetical protein
MIKWWYPPSLPSPAVMQHRRGLAKSSKAGKSIRNIGDILPTTFVNVNATLKDIVSHFKSDKTIYRSADLDVSIF